MICPDWRPLLAHRFDSALETPQSWPEAMRHLAGCEQCRRRAMAIDPTLAFQGAAAWEPTPGESAAIVQAVRTLRRTGDLERRSEQARIQTSARRPGRSRDRGPLAAAALFTLILAFQPATTSHPEGETSVVLEGPVLTGLARAARPAAPAIELVDRPGARVYEWGADDLSVVMVVDESLDV